LANLGELVTSAQQFEEEYDFEAEQSGDVERVHLREKLLAFLERVSLVSDADAIDSDQGMVTLMTLHAAKGLEYPVVAMLGVEDGLLPHERANDDEQELEEERRLAFVGITRAEERLYLCHGKYRTVFGQTTPTIRSRFLGELPADVIEEVDPSSDPDAYEDALFSGVETRSDHSPRNKPGSTRRARWFATRSSGWGGWSTCRRWGPTPGRRSTSPPRGLRR